LAKKNNYANWKYGGKNPNVRSCNKKNNHSMKKSHLKSPSGSQKTDDDETGETQIGKPAQAQKLGIT